MPSHAIITIDLTAKPQSCNGMIFGGFLEHFDNQIYLRR